MSPLRRYGLVVIIIWVGFGLRLHNLAGAPLRGDEAFSVLYWAELPLSQSLSQIAPQDPHPPFGYFLFRAWRLLLGEGGGDSPFALRILPVLGNIIGVPVLFVLGWRLSGKWMTGFLAAAMWALHPYEIWHSQDFRHYAIWAGTSAAALWLGLRLLERDKAIDWWLYGAAAAASALMFYTELFFMLALLCFAIQTRRRDPPFLRRFISLQFFVGVLALTSFLTLQAEQIFSGAYPGNLQAFALQDYLTRFTPALMLGETLPFSADGFGFGLSLIVGALLLFLRASAAKAFWLIALWLALPFLLIGAVSQRLDVFNPRYVLPAATAFILLLALGGSQLAARLGQHRRVADRFWPILLLSPWFALSLLTLDAHYNNESFRKAPAWDALGEFLNPRVEDSDLVIQLAVDPAFGYYYRGAARDIALPIKPSQPAAEIQATLSALSSEYASIYVVAREQAGWENAGVVVDWMRENMQEVLDVDVAGLPVRQYWHWTVPDTGYDELARYADTVSLLGYETCADPLPGGAFVLRLYWRPLADSARDLKTFAHVYDASGGKLWTQDDQYPQEGRLNATTWTQAGVFREIYYLPGASMPEGAYEIRTGWYEPDSGERLLLDDGTDSFRLCVFEIES